jgi:hypothetical protein
MMEVIDTPIKGIYRDILKGPGDRIIEDRGWLSNTIVTRCRLLLAGFMKNEPSDGIQFMAVGQGLEAWDSGGAPALDPATTTDLVNRFTPPVPVASLALVYLDAADTEVAGPTSRLQITATLPPGYPTPLAPLTTYPLREFGLFGHFGGEDYMINCIRHPVILKDVSTTLIRIVRLYF